MIDKSLINEDYSFTTTDEFGNELKCDTLALIENNNDPIIIYTDYTLDNENKFNLYVSKLVEYNGNFNLEIIENYENIPEVKETLNRIWSEMQNNN